MEKEYIGKEEFIKIKDQTLIIDVRDKLEHQTLKTFLNSVNIPYENLITEPEKYISDQNKLIIIYCNYGNRSDHRIIAKELDLYILEEKAAEYNFQEVITPILGSEELYQTSGHLAHYQDYMFPAMSRNNETYYLRPMTCPHHCLIYQQKPRSYRELPFRLGENSILHRYETSGALKGLERVRTMELVDHHIFVAPEQLKEEFKKNYHYINEILTTLNFKVSRLVYYDILKGEAAFYGPKLDIEIQAADGKNVTISTIQFDFVLPQKFGLHYIDKEQKLQTPAIIHHSPIGTYQRFISLLLEQTEGKLPFWLVPCHISILPLNEEKEVKEYCEKLKKELVRNNLRVKVQSEKSLNYRIRQVYRKRIPYYLVIGKEE
ncbi:9465_t:CDS:2, partial [Funneliformis geosporum]